MSNVLTPKIEKISTLFIKVLIHSEMDAEIKIALAF